MRILAGDVGGTKTELGVFEQGAEGEWSCLREASYPSGRHSGLSEIVRTFLADQSDRCEVACLGVAGPVRGGRVETTNLPWEVEEGELASSTGIPRVLLINDLEANAWGVEGLGDEDLHVLAVGAPEARGNFAVVSAGTGLGEAGAVWDGRGYRPFATEGGHSDLAPGSGLEVALWEHLKRRYGHVSWERVLSGPGLVELYRFLVEHRGSQVPGWLEVEMVEGDAAAAVTRASRQGRCELCREALRLFVRLYGAEAGNAALKLMATAGVYLGGGIPPKILLELEDPAFLEAFRGKGRMRPLLEKIPVRVILEPRTALRGAARCAARRGSEEVG